MYIAKNMRKLSIQFIQLHNFRIQLLYVSKHFFVFNHIYILCTAVTGYLIFLLCFSGHLSLRSWLGFWIPTAHKVATCRGASFDVRRNGKLGWRWWELWWSIGFMQHLSTFCMLSRWWLGTLSKMNAAVMHIFMRRAASYVDARNQMHDQVLNPEYMVVWCEIICCKIESERGQLSLPAKKGEGGEGQGLTVLWACSGGLRAYKWHVLRDAWN